MKTFTTAITLLFSLLLFSGNAIAQEDHSENEMGLFGNAFEGFDESEHWQHPGFEPHAPNTDGNIYTWKWEAVGLIEGRAFIFLEADGWGGLQFDYTQAELEGDAIENSQIVNEESVGGADPNFYVAEAGDYDLTLVYNSEDEEGIITISMVEIADHSETEVGIFGNAVEGYDEEDHWTHPGFDPHAPEVDGDVYTWSWDVITLIEERSFILLEADGWGGLQFDYTQAELEGDAIENSQIVNEESVGGADPNFYVAEEGVYTITLAINAETSASTITIVEAEGVSAESELERPVEYSLHQNYPNPFNPSTQIAFSLPIRSQVLLNVYNLLGQHIAQLANESYSAGQHAINFDASGLSSGIYIYRLEAGSFVQTRKMMLMK
ncbi:MAG: T9SS type A sorting domain-containing protein [Balneolaceae bacterium]